ncbi:hypothetical protein [Streptomyces beihaiensis]|uniref:Low molecular weight antigen MTB12-like C-terminal domain-containing protein n=1 Tax=Streptomyces beihaiensis TaxID=2984495 RepID=A0ABT3TTX2_9ACTN|nr:hypothetical protein [Streptomyces beihaiensis]MCX3060488.1 hypothetical protein [Streptomyces beihaiensis]
MVLVSLPGAGRGRGAVLALTAVLALGPAVAACGGGSGSGGGSPSPSQSPSAPPLPSPSRTPSPSGTAPADKAAATKEIKANWKKFFDPSTSLKDKESVLQNGSAMAQVLRGFNGDQRGRQVSAAVGTVTFTSPTAADVTYSLSLNGSTVLPDAKGTSVKQDGTWKVSDKTLCALVQLSGNASQVPGC